MLCRSRAVGAAIGAGCLVAALVSYAVYRRRRWCLVGRVLSLFIYPVKSCRGHSVQRAECTKLGLQTGSLADRRFMLVLTSDPKKFITAREEPLLVLINAELTADFTLILSHSATSSITVDLHAVTIHGKVIDSSLWSCKSVQGLDCGDEVSNWLSLYCGRTIGYYRLIYCTQHVNVAQRQVKLLPEHGCSVTRTELGQFGDLTPYFLMTQGSLDDLNMRTFPEKFDIRRFRPNILVDGTAALDEDNWVQIKFGDAPDAPIFRNVKPGTRCMMTTINPDTGEKHPLSEPLRTLRSYRQCNDRQRQYFGYSPLFGINLAINKLGSVCVGDNVYVTYK